MSKQLTHYLKSYDRFLLYRPSILDIEGYPQGVSSLKSMFFGHRGIPIGCFSFIVQVFWTWRDTRKTLLPLRRFQKNFVRLYKTKLLLRHFFYVLFGLDIDPIVF